MGAPALLLVAALALAGAPDAATNAQTADLLKIGDPGAVAVAFKAICLDHQDDCEAQIATATSAPWNFRRKVDGKGKKIWVHYVWFDASVSVQTGLGRRECSLGSLVNGTGATMDSATAIAKKMLSLGEYDRIDRITARWSDGSMRTYLFVGPGFVGYGRFTPEASK